VSTALASPTVGAVCVNSTVAAAAVPAIVTAAIVNRIAHVFLLRFIRSLRPIGPSGAPAYPDLNVPPDRTLGE
jgi:hypothetical protein